MFTKKQPAIETETEVQRSRAIVDTAAEKARQVLDLRQRIQHVATQTEAALRAEQGEYGTARAALALAQADAALGNGDDTAGLAAIGEASRKVEALEARRLGLEIRLRETDGQVLAALEEFRVVRKAWKDAVRAEFELEYQAAVNALAPVLRKGFALAQAIGGRFAGLETVSLPMLSDADRLLFRAHPTRVEGGQRVPYACWENDVAAEQLVVELAPLRDLFKLLESESEAIGNLREQEASRAAAVAAQGRRRTTGELQSEPEATETAPAGPGLRIPWREELPQKTSLIPRHQ